MRFLPAPNEVGGIAATKPDQPDEQLVREVTDDATFSGLAFKIAVDPFLGSLTFVRIYR